MILHSTSDVWRSGSTCEPAQLLYQWVKANMKIVVSLIALAFTLATAARAAETACEDLTKLGLPHAEITEARVVAKGEFAPPAGALGGSEASAAYRLSLIHI